MTAETSMCPSTAVTVGNFPYGPLNTDSREIRLLVLLPGSKGELISCLLEHVSFDDSPIRKFEALSYAWGPVGNYHSILVNGVLFDLRQNLYWALFHLRSSKTARVLWVDAVCINQYDISERNHQVQRMGEIYSSASQVIVWLGQETGDTRLAFDFLRRAKHRKFHEGSEKERLDRWRALANLCKLEYWRRLWIVQEIGLASRITIVCGRDRMSWRDLSDLFEELECSKIMNPKEALDVRQSLPARFYELRKTRHKSGCDLWPLMENFRQALCQEPHDKVYGFLGLASDWNSDDLPVNYAISIGDLYKSVIWFQYTKFLRKNDKSQLMLLVAFSEFLQAVLTGLPWIPFDPFWHRKLPPATSRRNISKLDFGPSIDPRLMEIVTDYYTVIRLFGPSWLDEQSGKGTVLAWQVNTLLKANALSRSQRYTESRWKTKKTHQALETVDIEKIMPIESSASFAVCDVPYGEILNQRSSKLRIGRTYDQDEVQRGSVLTNEPRFFLGDQSIGLAPKGAREGDIVCRFPETKIAVVIRPIGGKYCFIGRARVTHSTLDRLEIEGIPPSMRLGRYFEPLTIMGAMRDPVRFYMDFVTLQILTS